eukprot:Pgem_evm1s9473
MEFIYVLHLSDDKYYVGKTKNLSDRLSAHFNSNGSAWTKIYKPLKGIEVTPSSSIHDEDNLTLTYMKKYGIANVRGGSFCEVNMQPAQKELVEKMINTVSDSCNRCGIQGHFADSCNVTDNQTSENNSFGNNTLGEKNKGGGSFNSSRGSFGNGSFSNSSFGNGSFGNKNKTKRVSQKTIGKKNPSRSKSNKNACYKCGRTSHYATDCFASTHINGTPLLSKKK